MGESNEETRQAWIFQALPRVPTSNGWTPSKKYLDIKIHDVMYLNAVNIV
jgi:hypothetical protein